jgi:phosphate transport system permease protein
VSAAALPPRRTAAVESRATWSRVDRLGFYACWAAGLALCLVAASIVGYMLYKGLAELRPGLLVERPAFEADQTRAGGFLDPILGSLLVTAIGTAIALPLGVAVALWLTEYGRPRPLARAVESGIEVIAGTPSIVLAIFGLIVFSEAFLSFLSFRPENADTAFGRSFLIAGSMMSLIALPLVVGATREGLNAVPGHLREASYALGKTKAATIRRILLPAVRPNVAAGTALGMGRIIGDTAVIVILLGATLQLQPYEEGGPLGVLRGTGSTLTSYVFNNSPAGEGNSAEKAYAAAFVLLVLVVCLNAVVQRIAGSTRTPSA